MHAERLDAVLAALRARRAATIADLGCGEGPLLVRLAQDGAVERVVGLDCSLGALQTLRDRVNGYPRAVREKVDLVHGSMLDCGRALTGMDAAILVEAIEHLDPGTLPALERAVFRGMRPATVIVSTPNREFNGLLGVPPHRFRHPDHRFEWDRARFRRWADGVADRNGYRATCHDIAGCNPVYGGASQMAVFEIEDRGA